VGAVTGAVEDAAKITQAKPPDRAAAISKSEVYVELDPAQYIPVEASKAHLAHWWREPIAGLVSVGIGTTDIWMWGRDHGLTSSLDELLIIGGIYLMAGGSRLFRSGGSGGR
jgi:hypothetical protein